jgi:hypothetical protein
VGADGWNPLTGPEARHHATPGVLEAGGVPDLVDDRPAQAVALIAGTGGDQLLVEVDIAAAELGDAKQPAGQRLDMNVQASWWLASRMNPERQGDHQRRHGG